jgi:hypothetical protein
MYYGHVGNPQRAIAATYSSYMLESFPEPYPAPPVLTLLLKQLLHILILFQSLQEHFIIPFQFSASCFLGVISLYYKTPGLVQSLNSRFRLALTTSRVYFLGEEYDIR